MLHIARVRKSDEFSHAPKSSENKRILQWRHTLIRLNAVMLICVFCYLLRATLNILQLFLASSYKKDSWIGGQHANYFLSLLIPCTLPELLYLYIMRKQPKSHQKEENRPLLSDSSYLNDNLGKEGNEKPLANSRGPSASQNQENKNTDTLEGGKSYYGSTQSLPVSIPRIRSKTFSTSRTLTPNGTNNIRSYIRTPPNAIIPFPQSS